MDQLTYLKLVLSFYILVILSDNLNEKISLWQGDITTLEIDAIVNAGMLYVIMTRLLQKKTLNLLTFNSHY